jgi:signal transduction histidine kinase
MLHQNEEIFYSVIVGVALILFLVIIFIISVVRYKTRLTNSVKERLQREKVFEQEILKSQLEAREATLKQISEEFHDNIGQLLSSVVMLLGATERSLPVLPPTLEAAQQTLSKAIQEIRFLSKSLNKDWLSQYNLLDNLNEEVTRINSGGFLKIHLEVHTDVLPLSTEHQVILFRILQEAIQNTIKHAKASSLHIGVHCDNEVKIKFIDDGIGFNPEATTKGLGILNMKNRVALLNGTVQWQISEGQGTQLFISLPAQKEFV